VLTAAVATEASARSGADSVLTAAVATEATARSGADSVLAASIVTEANARLAEVAGERSRLDALVDSLGQASGVAELDGAGKLPISQLPLTTVVYCGTWDASTNTPTITSGQSPLDAGCYRLVSVAGSTPIDGESSWAVKDWIIWNGTVWSKVDNTESVTAVNGLQGAVALGLGGLTDVTVSGVAAGEILKYTGSNWINNTLNEAGIAPVSNATFTGNTTVANLSLTSTAVKIGFETGLTNQGVSTVAIGVYAGKTSQGTNAVAIGRNAVTTDQKNDTVAIGWEAGRDVQGKHSTAVGGATGTINQGDYCLALGWGAGYTNQQNRTICINASHLALEAPQTDAFYVKPIRALATSGATNVLRYNPSTGEITYTI